MKKAVEQNWIASFWSRIGALIVDTLILGMVGAILGLALERTFAQIGGWGRFVGFGVALIYFGVMNSKLFEGQTIGKRLLKLRVVSADNQTITLGRSLLRYTVLGIPFFLSGAHFSTEAMLPFSVYPFSLVVFGGLFSIVYLYLFNRVTRQSLHDLAVGTYVVNATIEKRKVGGIWKPHFMAIAVLFVAAITLPVFTGKAAESGPVKDLLRIQSALSGEPGVTYAKVVAGSSGFASMDGGTETTTFVNAQAFLSSNKVRDEAYARRLASVVVNNYPEARNKDALRITLSYGYDIGIWSQWLSQTHDFIPGEFESAE